MQTGVVEWELGVGVGAACVFVVAAVVVGVIVFKLRKHHPSLKAKVNPMRVSATVNEQKSMVIASVECKEDTVVSI